MGRRDSLNAVDFLVSAFHRIDLLFSKLRTLSRFTERRTVFRELAQEVTALARVEEDIFYPAMGALLSAEELDELLVEQDAVQLLLRDLGDDLGSTRFEGKLQVLREEIAYLADQQRPLLRANDAPSDVDPLSLGKKMIERHAELIVEMQEAEPILVQDSPYYRAHYTVRFNA